ncbi:MAG: hypothetical protein A2V92_02290 [Candidatus Muproteobacteria bacterium RBG_16_65_31]|uniref:Uncharacterized protein n=1 Tax=Candidatus Muproteobacteria bacterium RBG_16_65_31 TaxID=1817759 RepID=A0A1F6TII5_9PROT|nr:MAG: hypothetical protein A2V92_02290 [Candidatus Muproteobacteria bacterium RBG_16_65_31]
MALCSLSIGSSSAPERRASSRNRRPAITSGSLFANSTRLPARTAASVGNRPAAPTMAAITIRARGRVAARSRPSTPASTSIGRPASRIFSRSRSAARGSSMAAVTGTMRRHCSNRRSTCVFAVRASTR